MRTRRVVSLAVLAALPLVAPPAPAAGEPPGGGAPSPAASAAPSVALARAFLERLKTMRGDWVLHGADGEDETARIEVIAKGTVIKESSSGFHEGEEMLTLFHLDGDRLLLTHYCMAGNQPRLAATRIAEDASEAEFTFLDGTNLPSRDLGHMDHVVLRLQPEGGMSARWAWYEKGREAWMKEIRYERAR